MWLLAEGLEGCPVGQRDLHSALEQDEADAEGQQAGEQHPPHGLEAGSPAAGEGARAHGAQQGCAHSQGVQDGDAGVEGHDLAELGEGGDDAEEERDGGDHRGDSAGDDGHTDVPDCFHRPPLAARTGVLPETAALEQPFGLCRGPQEGWGGAV